MFTRIEALNYRSLHYVNQSLSPFQILLGPNASGKTTFLDVIAFVADVVNKSAWVDAIRERANDIHDLSWMRANDWFELAVEVNVPRNIRVSQSRLRYELRIGVQDETLSLLAETLWLITDDNPADEYPQTQLFPVVSNIPERITRRSNQRTPSGWRKIVNKTETGGDYFKGETSDWNNMFKLGPKRSALANLPDDESRFPAATWFKQYLMEGVQRIMLNSEALRRPSPPQSPRTFLPDGSNLPWVIFDLEQKAPERLQEWIHHIQTALPDINDIYTVERPEDRHRYLMLKYDNGLVTPSWTVSDGTLRLLALTILAYLPEIEGTYLIEEPENGIHPRAVETIFQALSSVYDAQVLMATHSPIILSMAKREQLLCFARTEAGETAIVRGDLHPRLEAWKGEVNLSTLFAAGVLG